MRHDPKNAPSSASGAEETAVAILGWLANEPDMLGRFLALTGVDASQLRQAINDPGFLAGMIDFVMGHEPTLLSFCEATGTRPETVASAWRYYSKPGLDSGEY
jgi:hypothetical protein